MAQVHKKTIDKVPKSKPGRDDIKYEIYGMDGVPDTETDGEPAAKKQKVATGEAAPTSPTKTLMPGIPANNGAPHVAAPITASSDYGMASPYPPGK